MAAEFFGVTGRGVLLRHGNGADCRLNVSSTATVVCFTSLSQRSYSCSIPLHDFSFISTDSEVDPTYTYLLYIVFVKIKVMPVL